jgi:ATP-dependent DNA helicase UvrD/PcrA
MHRGPLQVAGKLDRHRNNRRTRSANNMNIETLLNWGEPRNVTTARGERVLRIALPDAAFWGDWKRNKTALQNAGISPRKGRDGWEVCWWFDPAAVSPAAIVEQPQASVATVTPAAAVVAPSMNWSDEQNAIFNWFATGTDCLVVQARAGTGKTTTIKQAFSVAPEETMLYAVFNKKNQIEAQEKITDKRVDVRTLHSLGYRFIKQVWSNAQPDDAVEKDRIADACPGIPDEPAQAVERLVGFAKNIFLAPSKADLENLANERAIFSAEEENGWTVAKLAAVAFDALAAARERDAQGRVSFNDMVWLPVAMNWVRPCFDLVVVDEAQDMNMPQLEMAVRACSAGGRICVVGDDRQAIYGFRGAAQDGMGLMKTRLNATTLGLTTTYRCPKSVVAIAAEIVTDYKAADSAPKGIVDNIGVDRLNESLKVGDAVLSRLNAPLVSTCLNLLRNGVPAKIEGRDIGRQLVGMVRKLNAKSVPDFLRKLHTWGEKQIKRVSVGRNAESKAALVRDQVDCLSAIAEGAKSIFDIETRLNNLFADVGGNKSFVVLSSVHKAKGLEWNRVFLLASTFRKNKGDEEANIYYVAVTRAKKHLTFAE